MTDPNPTVRMPLPEEPAPALAPAEPAAAPAPAPRPAAPPPTWITRRSRDDGRTASVIFGIILLGIGAWFFAEGTLGFDLPEVSWGDLWPVILIGIGAWIVLGALRGRD